MALIAAIASACGGPGLAVNIQGETIGTEIELTVPAQTNVGNLIAIPANANVSDRLDLCRSPRRGSLSEGASRVGAVEGTLSLFDWNPTPDRVAVVEPASTTTTTTTTTTSPSQRVLVFDCETTGTDRARDQVIELCVQHGLSSDSPSRVWRIRPSVAIHPGAQAVHGISADDLASCPTFDALADEIAEVFAGADVIVGYNLMFDIDMLQAEYARIGKPWLDFTTKKIVDAFRLWQQFEPRSLQHAHQRFVGSEFAAAHTASADVAATGRVLAGMVDHFLGRGVDRVDWEELANKSDPQRATMLAERASWVGPSRHLRWEGETIVLGFGKYANAPLHEIAAGPDRSFLTWVLERDFPMHVTEVCRAALELSSEQFLAWARDHYGQAAPTTRPPFAGTAS